jgi:predicted RNase H-like HicB family nuclease
MISGLPNALACLVVSHKAGEEAVRNAKEAITLYIEALEEDGLPEKENDEN